MSKIVCRNDCIEAFKAFRKAHADLERIESEAQKAIADAKKNRARAREHYEVTFDCFVDSERRIVEGKIDSQTQDYQVLIDMGDYNPSVEDIEAARREVDFVD